jgi:predicted O-methyltransferase YrrM
LKQLKDIPGFLSEAEADLLMGYATLSRGDILEIGTYAGKSAITMASFTSHTVYTIDPLAPHSLSYVMETTLPKWIADPLLRWGKNSKRQKIYRNIYEFNVMGRVRLIEGFSHDVVPKLPDNGFGMVFIDGDHSYPSAKVDLMLCYSKLMPGGYMLVHDCNGYFPGVERAVNEEMIKSNLYENVEIVTYDSKIAIGKKKGYVQ